MNALQIFAVWCGLGVVEVAFFAVVYARKTHYDRKQEAPASSN